MNFIFYVNRRDLTLVRCRLPFWVHLGMHQNTNTLEDVLIEHKTRSAMHLFLTPHQRFKVRCT